MEPESPDLGVGVSEYGAVLPDGEQHVGGIVGRGDEHVVEAVPVGIALYKSGQQVARYIGVLPAAAYTPAEFASVALGNYSAPLGLALAAAVDVPAGTFGDIFPSGLVCDAEITDLHAPEVLLPEVPFGDVARDVDDPAFVDYRRAVVLQFYVNPHRIHLALGEGGNGEEKQEEAQEDSLKPFHLIC